MKQKAKLAIGALTKYLVGVVAISALLFVPAGSIEYTGAWRLLALLFVPMLLLGIVLLITSPELLQRRLDSKEKRTTQSGIVRLSGLIFVVGFVVAGLDWRFGWSCINTPTTIIASLLFLLGYGLYWEVMRENVWLSRTIGVSEGQKDIQTGLYGIVRHPMYFATLLMFLPIPLILGSWWALCAFVLYIPIIAIRTLDEERLLCVELHGYEEYCQRIRWRIFPFIW